MTVVFPNMGNLTAILCAFMRDIDGSFVGPIPTNKHTAQLGSKYAPNDACMPMKIVLGNFIEGYENGADTALFFGGCGPCCFGYFAETFQLIFRQNNLPLRVVALENNLQGVKDALTFLSSAGKKSLPYCTAHILKGLKCAEQLDIFEQSFYNKRAEIENAEEKQRLNRFYSEMQRKLNAAASLDALKALAIEGTRELKAFRSDTSPQVKIGIVGDIYTVIDPFMNKNVQAALADMGAYTKRSMTIGGWIDDKVRRKPQEWSKPADQFLFEKVGGFARETVGNAALWANRDFDGIIELYPLNCMPESVARSILPSVSAKYNKPMMSLVVDEMSGEAGYITRLEAFTQMIIRKKDTEIERAVSGH